VNVKHHIIRITIDDAGWDDGDPELKYAREKDVRVALEDAITAVNKSLGGKEYGVTVDGENWESAHLHCPECGCEDEDGLASYVGKKCTDAYLPRRKWDCDGVIEVVE